MVEELMAYVPDSAGVLALLLPAGVSLVLTAFLMVLFRRRLRLMGPLCLAVAGMVMVWLALAAGEAPVREIPGPLPGEGVRCAGARQDNTRQAPGSEACRLVIRRDNTQ